MHALLLFCLGCGGGPSFPPPQNAAGPIESEEGWLARVLKTPDGDIDLLESVAILSCSPAQRSMAAEDVRGFLAPSMEEARERMASAKDSDHRILALNRTVLPRIEQGLSGSLRFVREGLGSQDGDCLPMSLLYAQAASELGLPLEIVSVPSHVFVRCISTGGIRNIEPTAGGAAATNAEIRDAIQHRIRGKESFPESSELLEKCFGSVSRRQCVALLYCQRAAKYLEQGNKASARADYATALRISPEWYIPHYRSGMCEAEALGNFKAAQDELTLAIERAPYLPQLFYNRGVAQEQLQNLDAALRDYESARRLAPRNPLFTHAIGTLQVDLGKYPEAIASFTRALELDPDREDSRHNRAQVWEHHLRDLPRAIEDYSILLEKKPKVASYWGNRGACYANLRKFAAALGDLDRAVELDPRNGSIRRNRGAALANSGRLRDALPELDEALSIDSKDRNAYAMRARVRQLLGDAEGQRQDLEKAASLPNPKGK
ncbi:MAG TPA: tetratricopeptide repeat protein [Planctomycetota bacterium]|nr:tetratricopeptide repeat protein [Planctomycetota bacterium]